MPRIQIIGAIFTVFAWLAYDHYQPWVNFHSEALAMLGLGLLAIAECFRRQTDAKWRMPWRPVAAIGVVLAFIWLQFLLGIGSFFGDALVVSLYLFGLAIAIALGYRLATVDLQNAGLRWVFTPLVVASVASAIIGLLQWLNVEGVLGTYVVAADVGDRPMGNMGQPNQLATLLLMGLVSLAWLHCRGCVGATVSLPIAGLLTLVLVLTQSRAGMLGAVLSSVFLTWKAQTTPSRLAPRFYLLWLLGYLSLWLLLPTIYSALNLSGLRDAESLVRTDDRYVLWRQAVAAITQSPWLGYGWLQTPAAQAVGSVVAPGTTIFTFAHNIVLDMLIWNGVPMGLMTTFLCAWWFLTRLRKANSSNALFAMATLLPILAHSMVEYPFAYSYFLLSSGLLVGVIESAHPRSVIVALRRKLIAFGLGVWFLIGAVVVGEYLRVEADYRLARLVIQRLEHRPPNFEPPSMHLLTQFRALLNAIRIEPTRDMPPGDLEVMRLVLHRFPNREVRLNYILALSLNRETQEAIHQLSVLRSMYGQRSFELAKFELRNMQSTYPEIASVLAVP